jgi:hypothetical protein
MLKYSTSSTTRTNKSSNVEFSRIISAAVVNKSFRSTLLSDPSKAIAQGYYGEPFSLSSEQKNRISTIREDSLEGFAAKLAMI